ncbi:tyrosine-type recombinase/integrase [Nostoc sp.]|uniref:tyrosine-type recombinase/integrase n=1 Tax=Nostoc sp. TaxID=1180 RepID=UPI002FF8182F
MRIIKVIKNGDSCLIRWTYQDERYSIGWGRWVDKVEKARLEFCAKIIYQDCLTGNFDYTLSKYKCWLEGIIYTGSNGNSKPTPKSPPLLTLLEQRLEGYYNVADESLLRHLKNYKKVISTPQQAKEFIAWLKDKGNKPSTLKRYLTILQVLKKDLFGDIEVKIPGKPKPKPFSASEVDRILDSLLNDQHYSHYYGFILMLFNTGLRVSEGIGLRWQDIDLQKREIHMYESLGRNRNSSSNTPSTNKQCCR